MNKNFLSNNWLVILLVVAGSFIAIAGVLFMECAAISIIGIVFSLDGGIKSITIDGGEFTEYP